MRIQTRWRATSKATTTAKAKTLVWKNIDISDLLIQNALVGICDLDVCKIALPRRERCKTGGTEEREIWNSAALFDSVVKALPI